MRPLRPSTSVTRPSLSFISLQKNWFDDNVVTEYDTPWNTSHVRIFAAMPSIRVTLINNAQQNTRTVALIPASSCGTDGEDAPFFHASSVMDLAKRKLRVKKPIPIFSQNGEELGRKES